MAARTKPTVRGSHGYRGVFITFEGCEGSGKTAQVEMLEDNLLKRGLDAVVSSEPGGTPVGEKIREILLDTEYESISPVTEALLFTADRTQKIMEVIRPALQKGRVVIGDRYTDSSLAYQGVGRGVGLEAVRNLNEWATGDLEPDLTFYLDMPARQALARKAGRPPDRIEREPAEFHENVRHAYNMLVRMYPHRIVVLDATANKETIHSQVLAEVGKHL